MPWFHAPVCSPHPSQQGQAPLPGLSSPPPCSLLSLCCCRWWTGKPVGGGERAERQQHAHPDQRTPAWCLPQVSQSLRVHLGRRRGHLPGAPSLLAARAELGQRSSQERWGVAAGGLVSEGSLPAPRCTPRAQRWGRSGSWHSCSGRTTPCRWVHAGVHRAPGRAAPGRAP